MRLAVAIAALAIIGCAGSTPQPASHLHSRVGAVTPPVRAARAPFAPERFHAVFERAARAVRARGWEILACEPDLGAITTARVEADAPCGGSTCLVRETMAVKLGLRRARVVVTREVWDQTVRAWRPPDDPTSLANIELEELNLLQEAVTLPDEGMARRISEECGDASCDPLPSACLVAGSGDGT
jgi:hypothetical protein